MGFCFGVRRAVQMMEEAGEQQGNVATLGAVVHNPLVTERLAQRGVHIIGTLDELRDRPIAISAHGVGPRVLQDLEQRGAEIIDTTCPIVTRSQQWARRLTEDGFAVIVFGDPNHKEVRGVLGWATGRVLCCQDESDIDSLPDDLPSKIGVLSQTTHTEERFASFVRALFAKRMDRISELRVINTLCNATTGQQAAARELARQVQTMVVVGGRESANTRHLVEICHEEGVPAYHIERAGELRPEWFRGVDVVGVTAGASTPDFSIDEVVLHLEALEPA